MPGGTATNGLIWSASGEQGLTVAGDAVDHGGEQPPFRGLEETLAAMRAGVDVIYQAALEDEVWSGRVDFLRQVHVPSELGAWSYEVFDTKLARETKCCFSHSLVEPPGDLTGLFR